MVGQQLDQMSGWTKYFIEDEEGEGVKIFGKSDKLVPYVQ